LDSAYLIRPGGLLLLWFFPVRGGGRRNTGRLGRIHRCGRPGRRNLGFRRGFGFGPGLYSFGEVFLFLQLFQDGFDFRKAILEDGDPASGISQVFFQFAVKGAPEDGGLDIELLADHFGFPFDGSSRENEEVEEEDQEKAAADENEFAYGGLFLGRDGFELFLNLFYGVHGSLRMGTFWE